MISRRLLFLPFIVSLTLVSGCSGGTVAEDTGDDVQQKRVASLGKIGGGGFDELFTGGGSGEGGGAGIAVNSYLWRASLDTISFFPLIQADPFGGVIITDWFTPPDSTASRFKLNVFILGRELRADGLRVSAFKQVQTSNGQWIDTAVADDTVASLENAILAKARELRIVASTLE